MEPNAAQVHDFFIQTLKLPFDYTEGRNIVKKMGPDGAYHVKITIDDGGLLIRIPGEEPFYRHVTDEDPAHRFRIEWGLNRWEIGGWHKRSKASISRDPWPNDEIDKFIRGVLDDIDSMIEAKEAFRARENKHLIDLTKELQLIREELALRLK